jgi:hypothetical protein
MARGVRASLVDTHTYVSDCSICGKQMKTRTESHINKLVKLHMRLQHNIINFDKITRNEPHKKLSLDEYKKYLSEER